MRLPSRSAEASGVRVVRNTAFTAGGRGINIALAVLLTPFLLHRLGPEQYGVWVLATTLTLTAGYLSLADLGLRQAAVRQVADARSRGDRRAVAETVATTTWFYLGLGLVLALVLALAARPLAELFGVTADLQDAAALAFLLVGVQIAVDLPAAGATALIEGVQRHGVFRAVDVVARLAWGAGTVLVVAAGHGIVAIAAVSLGVAVVRAVAAFWIAERLESGRLFRPSAVRRSRLRVVLGDGKKMFALRILDVAYSQMDRLVIGIALGTAAVAFYDVAFKIHVTAAAVLGVVPSAVMPAAAYLAAAGDRERLRELFLRGTRYAVALGVPLSVAAILYARPLLSTWVGAEYESLTGATRLFLVYPAIAVTVVVGQAMLTGLSRMREMLRLQVGALAVNLAVSVLLVSRVGIIGVIWGTLAGAAVLWGPMTALFLREFGVGALEWARRVLLPVVPAVAVQLAFGWLTVGFAARLDQLWAVIALVATSYALAGLTFVVVSLSPAERDHLRRSLLRWRSAETATAARVAMDQG